MEPSISVVVAARNAAGTLSTMLGSVGEQLGGRDEIVVVDDGSVDDTAAVARRAGARVVRLAVANGLGAAHDVGVRAASGTVVAFLDADDVPQPGYLEALRRAFAGGAEAVAGELLPDERPGAVVRHGVATSGNHDLAGRNGFLPAVTGAAMAVRADILHRVGGSEPRLKLASDTDLSFRLALAGVAVERVPEAAVRYRQRDGLAGYLRNRFRRGFWEAFLAWRWQEFTFADARGRAGRRRPLRELARAGAHLVSGHPEAAAASALDALTVASLRLGRAVGSLDLMVGGWTTPPAPIPATFEQALLATPLAGAPPFVVRAPDRRAAVALAAALRCHPSLAAPPPGLAGVIGDRFGDGPPWARTCVRWVNRLGWRLDEDLAARRLEAAAPDDLAGVYATMHAIAAWLYGKGCWTVVEVGDDAERAARALRVEVRPAVLSDAGAVAAAIAGDAAPAVTRAVPLAAIAAALPLRRRPSPL